MEQKVKQNKEKKIISKWISITYPGSNQLLKMTQAIVIMPMHSYEYVTHHLIHVYHAIDYLSMFLIDVNFFHLNHCLRCCCCRSNANEYFLYTSHQPVANKQRIEKEKEKTYKMRIDSSIHHVISFPMVRERDREKIKRQRNPNKRQSEEEGTKNNVKYLLCKSNL